MKMQYTQHFVLYTFIAVFGEYCIYMAQGKKAIKSYREFYIILNRYIMNNKIKSHKF